MDTIFSTVQFILNNILQDLEIQNLTNHLKFESLPYFSQIRAITKPELSTFDSEKEIQKVETSHEDNVIVSTYGMIDNSSTNEVFKRKNGFKPRINSFVNPTPKIREELTESDNNQSVMFMDDDYVNVYGLNDESILWKLANLEREEELERIQKRVMESNVSLSSSEASNLKSYTNSNMSLSSNNSSNNIVSQDNINNSNNNSQENINNNNSQKENVEDNNSQEKISNNNSKSYISFNDNHSNSINNIDKSASNISNSIKNISNSSVEISKSCSYNQSQVTNSNEEVNKSESFIGSSRSQSFTLSTQSQSQESFNSNHSQSTISASNSDINSLNEYLVNPDHSESMETIQNDALIFPEVADGQTLEIIQ